MNVLSVAEDGRVRDVTAFIVRAPDDERPDDHRRFPERPIRARFGTMFERFGLPDRTTGWARLFAGPAAW